MRHAVPIRRILLLAALIASASARATTYYVATTGDDSAAGTEAAPLATVATALGKSDVTEVVVAAGTYKQTAVISISSAVTLRGATGVATDVTLDFQTNYQGLSLNHASAVVQDLRIYRGSLSGNGAGVAVGTNGGTVRNCRFESCYVTASGKSGPVYLNSANALMTGCEIRSCGNAGGNGDSGCIGVYVGSGATLENTLVVGTQETSAYADGKARRYAVQLANGKVKNCTITGNTTSDVALYCSDSANCEVTDTICWNNTSLRGMEENGPNVNVLGTKCVVNNLYLQNPMFQDVANGDYTLAPGSPCIGAGTGGGDLGYKPYDSTKAALGIKASVRTGTAPLSVTVELTAANVDLTGATVTWDGLAETGTSFTHSFGGGNHALKATVTLSDSTVMTVHDPKALEIAYAPGEYTASTSDELDAMLLAPQADGVTFKLLANTTYTLPQNCYKIIKAVKVVGAGRESSILRKKSESGRFFYLNNEKAEIDSLTMMKVNASYSGCPGGIVWIASNGGTVSNCVVSGGRTGASQTAGGILMESANALVTHSLIKSNVTGQNTGGGAVVLRSGTLANSLIVSNTFQYAARPAALGGGVYMGPSTADAKVINCTISANTGYSAGGLYRVAGAGYVYNTIVFGNTATYASGVADFVTGDGTTRPPSEAIRNCASSTEVGTNAQVVTEAPYDLSYQLVGEKAGRCINKGDKTRTMGTLDYFGGKRIVGKEVDIGAHEYASLMITVGIDAAELTGVDSAELVFAANVQGAEPEDCTYAWYVDSSGTVAGRHEAFTNTFTTGQHSLRLVVTVEGTEYIVQKPSDYIKIYASDSYVDVNSTVAPVWPFPQSAPATDFAVAVRDALVSGVTLHVAEGRYVNTNRTVLGTDMHVVGAGLDKTVLYHPRRGAGGFTLQSVTATVSGLCVSNSVCSGGGGFSLSAGTVTDCKVTHCEAEVNQSGGGIQIDGQYCPADGCLVDRCIITDCARYQWNGATMASGGGAYVGHGAILRNSLVTRCHSNNGGGVALQDGVMKNCTVVSNWVDTCGGGGGGVSSGGYTSVTRNSIVWGNRNDDLSDDPTSSNHAFCGVTAYSDHNCAPSPFGASAVTNAPRFKQASSKGLYRLGADSPCRRVGLYEDWMADATDFFGSPRATHRLPDIGYHQAGVRGLVVIVE